MPISAGLAAGLQAASSIGSSIFGNIGSKRREDRANKQNLKFWNMQNQYNDPTSQMQRLRKAGLNPHLVYGGSSGGSAGQASPVPAAKASPYSIDNPKFEMDSFANLKQTEATTNNIVAQGDVILKEKELKQAQILSTLANTTHANLGNSLLGRTLDYSVQAAAENLRQLQLKTSMATKEDRMKNPILQAQYDSIKQGITNAKETHKGIKLQNKIKEYETELNKIGISKNDPLWLRAFGKVFQEGKKQFKSQFPTKFKF